MNHDEKTPKDEASEGPVEQPDNSEPELPAEILQLILSQLSFKDLADARATSRFWKQNADAVLTAFATKIDCSLKENSPLFEQIEQSVKELIEKASEIIYRPKDIELIIQKFTANPSIVTIPEIQLLQDWLKARDTINVWKALAEQTPGKLVIPDFGDLSNTQELIDKAKEFSSWFNENRDSLAKILSLELDDMQLTSLPPEIGKLSQLQYLSLWRNSFTTLPSGICNLSQLVELQMSQNKLTTLPAEIGNLSLLRKLSLTNNKLKVLPPEFCKLNQMYKLALGNNLLVSLPTDIGNLTKLKSLYLHNNKLKSLPSSMGKMTQLKSLLHDGNSFSSKFKRSLPFNVNWIIKHREGFGKNHISLLREALLATEPHTPQKDNFGLFTLDQIKEKLGDDLGETFWKLLEHSRSISKSIQNNNDLYKFFRSNYITKSEVKSASILEFCNKFWDADKEQQLLLIDSTLRDDKNSMLINRGTGLYKTNNAIKKQFINNADPKHAHYSNSRAEDLLIQMKTVIESSASHGHK